MSGPDQPAGRFDGKVALVTGASRGIGAAVARAFAGAGAAVVLAARDGERLDAVAGEIRDAGGRALAVPTDVTDADAVARLVDRAVEAFGRLDVACNNAAGGGHPPTPLAEVPVEAFDSATKVAALDHAGDGVRVNAVAPGPILTDGLARAGEAAQQAVASTLPLRRVGLVDEVAEATLWLCSDAAAFVTGTTLVVDGGRLAGTPPFARRS